MVSADVQRYVKINCGMLGVRCDMGAFLKEYLVVFTITITMSSSYCILNFSCNYNTGWSKKRRGVRIGPNTTYGMLK